MQALRCSQRSSALSLGRRGPQPATPAAALQALVVGNCRNAAGQPRKRDFSVRRAAHAQGKASFAAVLRCADSRVASELVFDQLASFDTGDMLLVTRIDRLAQSTRDLLNIMAQITAKGAKICSLAEA